MKANGEDDEKWLQFIAHIIFAVGIFLFCFVFSRKLGFLSSSFYALLPIDAIVMDIYLIMTKVVHEYRLHFPLSIA